MKITDLKCAVIGDNPTIRITTDEGLSGYGQAEVSAGEAVSGEAARTALRTEICRTIAGAWTSGSIPARSSPPRPLWGRVVSSPTRSSATPG